MCGLQGYTRGLGGPWDRAGTHRQSLFLTSAPTHCHVPFTLSSLCPFPASLFPPLTSSSPYSPLDSPTVPFTSKHQTSNTSQMPHPIFLWQGREFGVTTQGTRGQSAETGWNWNLWNTMGRDGCHSSHTPVPWAGGWRQSLTTATSDAQRVPEKSPSHQGSWEQY